MADVSILKLENDSYNIKDTTARNNINNLSNYSSNEVVIGSWIDGKPLYRQVISTTTPNSLNPTSIGSISNLNKIINIYGFFTHISASTQQVPLTFSYSNTVLNTIYIENTDIMCKLNNSVYQSKDCFIVCEYTKTTD